MIKQLPSIGSLLFSVRIIGGLGIAILDFNIRMKNSNLKHFEIENDQIAIVMAWKKDNMNHLYHCLQTAYSADNCSFRDKLEGCFFVQTLFLLE